MALSDESVMETKRPRYCWYFKLESESSCTSQEDQESVYSIQNRETDVAKDTTDTDTKSTCSEFDLEVDVEYELASSHDSDNPLLDVSASSSGTDDALAAVGAISAVICDSSYEAWATDEEGSDSSSIEDTPFNKGDFWICAQCKLQKNNPQFPYCDRCFQVRKSLFPPRPRRQKKRRPKKEKPVKLETLQSCLNVLSQDSGVGSSQDLPLLQLEKIVVPTHLRASSSGNVSDSNASRKRQYSESSLSEHEDSKRIKLDEHVKKQVKSGALSNLVGTSSASTARVKAIDISSNTPVDDVPIATGTQTSEKEEVQTSASGSTPTPSISVSENKELCIMCNVQPKNSIFLHGNIAHMCSCYKCAMRTWGINKKCPMCNCKARNVVKVYCM